MSDTPLDRLSVAQAAESLLNVPQTPLEDDGDKSEDIESEADVVETEADAESQDDSYEEEDGEEAESDDEEEYEDDDEEEPAYTVKVDGKEERVTLEELRRGYSRQADYTRKTSELAQQRREIEQQSAQLQQLGQHYAQHLQTLEQRLAQSVEKEPDWDQLYDDDPIGYAKKRDDWNRQQQERQRVSQERQRVQQQQLQQYAQQQAARLPELIPEWKDPAKAKSEQDAVVTFAQTRLGFSPQELSQVYDARIVQALRLAWLGDRSGDRKSVAEKKVRKAPKMTKGGKPTSKKQSQQRREQELSSRLTRTGRVDDAVELLMQRKGG